MKKLLTASLMLAFSACSPSAPSAQTALQLQPPSSPVYARAEARNPSASTPDLKTNFVTAQSLPSEIQQSSQAQVQTYADEVSRRRQIDFFQIHPNAVGLELQAGQDHGRILSWLGTARSRNDLNVEIRLLQGSDSNLNLNYSGPVTQTQTPSQIQSQSDTLTLPNPQAAQPQNSGLKFELMMGLPNEGVTRAYGDYLEALSHALSQRYQARPMSLNDSPLVYALTQTSPQGDQLRAFVFCNQRNQLVLGERKYADVQSLVVLAPDHSLLGAYTLIGFNPKTASAQTAPSLKREEDPDFGTLIEFGEY